MLEEIELAVKDECLYADPSSSDSEDNIEYEVEYILDTDIHQGKRVFRIKWKGYPESDATWELQETLECHQIIDNFIREKVKRDPPPEKIKITEAIIKNGEVEYIGKCQNGKRVTMSSLEAKNNYPKELIRFIESKIKE